MSMARCLNPLGCRVGRAERTAVVRFARERGMSVSMVLKIAMREYIARQPPVEYQPVVAPQPQVHAGVHTLLSDTARLPSPPLTRPFRLREARCAVRRRWVASARRGCCRIFERAGCCTNHITAGAAGRNLW